MSDIPIELRYATSHEWTRLDEGTVTVGVSDFAQESLGDVVYVELPEPEQEVQAGTEACVVESVKAAADIYAPVTGVVVEVNSALLDTPELVNQDPYGDGWFFRVAITDVTELDDLLDADGYREHCESEDGE